MRDTRSCLRGSSCPSWNFVPSWIFVLEKQVADIAPTTVIDSPQASSLLKTLRTFSAGRDAAMQSAPVVESGDRSTRCAPMFIDAAIATGSPPPSRSIRPGIVGRNAGSTTPEVLL